MIVVLKQAPSGLSELETRDLGLWMFDFEC